MAGEARLEAHALAVDLRARVAEQRTRDIVAANVHPDLREELIGRRLDLRQALVGQQVVGRDATADERRCLVVSGLLTAVRDPGGASSGPSRASTLAHGQPLCSARSSSGGMWHFSR